MSTGQAVRLEAHVIETAGGGWHARVIVDRLDGGGPLVRDLSGDSGGHAAGAAAAVAELAREGAG